MISKVRVSNQICQMCIGHEYIIHNLAERICVQTILLSTDLRALIMMLKSGRFSGTVSQHFCMMTTNS